jgi:hypothetical protein
MHFDVVSNSPFVCVSLCEGKWPDNSIARLIDFTIQLYVTISFNYDVCVTDAFFSSNDKIKYV